MDEEQIHEEDYIGPAENDLPEEPPKETVMGEARRSVWPKEDRKVFNYEEALKPHGKWE